MLVGACVAAELLYALIVTPSASTSSAAVLFSLASLVADGLFGFLFGIPHTGATTSTTALSARWVIQSAGVGCSEGHGSPERSDSLHKPATDCM